MDFRSPCAGRGFEQNLLGNIIMEYKKDLT